MPDGNVDERGCYMVESEPHDWVCLVHRGEQWETARAMGAQLPCRIPVSRDEMFELVHMTDCPPNTLSLLATDPEARMRRMAARHHSMPPEMLAQLAGDHDSSVRQAAAENSEIPKVAFGRLAADPNWAVLAALAANPAIDADTINRLAAHPDARVRAALAQRGGPKELLRRLAQDLDEGVRLEVAAKLSDKACA